MPNPVLILGAAAIGASLAPMLDRAVEQLPRHATVPEEQPATVGVAGRRTMPNLGARDGMAPGCTRECRRPVPARRAIIGGLSAGLFTALAARFGWSWDLAPALALTGAVIPLAFCDLEHLLLPRRLVRIGTAVVAASVLIAAAATGAWHQAGVAGLSGIVAGAALGGISMVNPAWLGFGDSRLAALVGLGVGWYGAAPVIGAMLLANVGAGAIAGGVIVSGRRDSVRALPFGIFLAGGAIGALLLTG